MKLKVPAGFAQATLPTMEPPPAECRVSRSSHVWRAMTSYSEETRADRGSAADSTARRVWPDAAYQPFCVHCGIPQSQE